MPFGTTSVAVATTPTVFKTFFSHLLLRKKKTRAGKPTAQLSYDEGLQIVRQFLQFASQHTVEELQGFTAMHVPNPNWVRKVVVEISPECISVAEKLLMTHLESYGQHGLADVGGSQWWTIRGRTLEGEWIEMKKDYMRRTAAKVDEAHQQTQGKSTNGAIRDGSGNEVMTDRIILYIHGGAFFFSSLDTHRYQIQRHARKLGGRAFAPSYRLAPQYPFPCGLLDALASYLYLIAPPPSAPHQPISPTSIILSGDSAGAGMVLSLLVLIREMKLPMPAGASLISPWVDLSHSFPSIVADDKGDYIPSDGFHYKPSLAWPPIPGDGVTVEINGEMKLLEEQVQMYCPNALLGHPLVSPVNQGSLGGLCPLMIMGGSSELLRDEIIYVAHKAAAPETYIPSASILEKYPEQRALITKYKPTKVHLQIFDGCAHVTPTLSFTTPAKYMYRAAANFNIWALTAAAKAVERHGSHKSHHPSRSSTLDSVAGLHKMGLSHPVRHGSLDLSQPIIDEHAAELANEDPMDDDDLESEASSDSDADPDVPASELVSVSGVEPSFGGGHIVRERVSPKGRIRPFEPISEVSALQVPSDSIGAIHSTGPIMKWLAARAKWDTKYSSELAKYRNIKTVDRIEAEKTGYLTRTLHQERPPLCALVGWYDTESARAVGKSVDEVSTKTSGAVALWMKMSTKSDGEQAGHEEIAALGKQMEDQGVARSTQEVAGDAPVAAIKDHIEQRADDAGVNVKEAETKPSDPMAL